MNDLSSDRTQFQPIQTRHLRTVTTHPYQVRIAGSPRGRFEDLRDAISSARLIKRDHPMSHVIVTDLATGQIVIEIDV